MRDVRVALGLAIGGPVIGSIVAPITRKGMSQRPPGSDPRVGQEHRQFPVRAPRRPARVRTGSTTSPRPRPRRRLTAHDVAAASDSRVFADIDATLSWRATSDFRLSVPSARRRRRSGVGSGPSPKRPGPAHWHTRIGARAVGRPRHRKGQRMNSSAICTAFRAAPLRRLSLLMNSASPRPPSTDESWRTRPT